MKNSGPFTLELTTERGSYECQIQFEKKEGYLRAALAVHIKGFVTSGRYLVATASKDGFANVGPKGSVMVADDWILENPALWAG
jgi:hypothetical protein